MQHAARFSHDQLGESGRARDKMLADCFEATIGALYLDRQPLGLAAVKAFTSAVLFPITQGAGVGCRDPECLQLPPGDASPQIAVPIYPSRSPQPALLPKMRLRQGMFGGSCVPVIVFSTRPHPTYPSSDRRARGPFSLSLTSGAP
eukprot:scaffold6737_cov101-Isochrysis_galbana.AAC.1